MTASSPGHQSATRRKDLAIESLRGLAVILMVAGHVIGSTGTRGLQVADDSPWRLSYTLLEDLRMPLFTAISGYVYALRPARGHDQYRDLLKGKSRRLLIPLITTGALMFVLQSMVPGVNWRPDLNDAWRIYVFPFEHLWFLQAIFLIFVLIGILDATGRLDRIRSWACALAAASVLHVAVKLPADADVFSVNGFLRLLPFFILGLGIHRFGPQLDLPRWLAWSVPVFAVSYGLRLAGILMDVRLSSLADRTLSLAVGLSGLLSLFLLRRVLRIRPLAWLGGFSFTVYLLHVFAAAGTRIVLQHYGVDRDGVLFVAALVAGIALPVAFELTVGRNPLVARLLLGQKARPRAEQPALLPASEGSLGA